MIHLVHIKETSHILTFRKPDHIVLITAENIRQEMRNGVIRYSCVVIDLLSSPPKYVLKPWGKSVWHELYGKISL